MTIFELLAIVLIMEETDNTIDLIKLIRKEKNISQNEMAEKLGITTSQYSNYETGRSEMTLNTFFKILSIMDMKIEDFFKIEKIKLSLDEIDFLIEVLNKLKLLLK